jgi:hypothetical protein
VDKGIVSRFVRGQRSLTLETAQKLLMALGKTAGLSEPWGDEHKECVEFAIANLLQDGRPRTVYEIHMDCEHLWPRSACSTRAAELKEILKGMQRGRRVRMTPDGTDRYTLASLSNDNRSGRPQPAHSPSRKRKP